jgi:cobalt-zinc-cadmium efflux system membrane fusion protein
MKRRHLLLFLLGTLLAFDSACRNQRQLEDEGKTKQPVGTDVSTEVVLDDETARRMGIEVEQAERTNLPQTLRTTGRIVAQVQRTREVRTPFTGRVESVGVEVGQEVGAGQVLAVLASPDLPSLRADLAKAEAALATAQKTVDRQKRLAEIGAGSQRELQQAQLDLDTARIERDRALLRIRQSGLDPDKLMDADPRFNLSAPQPGVVVERNASPGELAKADTALFRIVNIGTVDALLDVYETNLGSVRVGQLAEIRVPAYPDGVFRGRVTSIGALLNAQAHTAQVRATLSNPGHLLKPEMLCDADLITGHKPNVVAVPESALVDDDGAFVVYVRSGQKYVRRPLQLGMRTIRAVEIISGVTPGEFVVTRGGYQLKAVGLKARPEAEHE